MGLDFNKEGQLLKPHPGQKYIVVRGKYSWQIESTKNPWAMTWDDAVGMLIGAPFYTGENNEIRSKRR